jgi:hypothetical protein
MQKSKRRLILKWLAYPYLRERDKELRKLLARRKHADGIVLELYYGMTPPRSLTCIAHSHHPALTEGLNAPVKYEYTWVMLENTPDGTIVERAIAALLRKQEQWDKEKESQP